MACDRWKPPEASKNATDGRQVDGVSILGYEWYTFHWLPRKKKSIDSDYYIELLDRLKAEITKKRPHIKKKKVILHQDNAPCHKSIKTMAKINELGFKLLPHPPYSPDLAPSDYWLFADLKKMLQGKRYASNEEVIAATEAYFESKDKSFYKHGIEKWQKRWNDCIALEDYVDE